MPFDGTRMKLRRKQLKLTQRELAETLHTSQQHIAMWEGGDKEPVASTLQNIAKALNCTTDWLFGLVNEPTGQVQQSDLSMDERRLIELYRRGELPDQIRRLLTETSRSKSQVDLIVNGRDEAEVSADDVALDS